MLGLDGIPADGGFGSVDAAPHELRADHAHGYVSTRATAMRLVAQAGPGCVRSVSSLAGGVIGVLGSPLYASLKRECSGDAALGQRVEALLQADEQAGEFLDEPAPGVSPETVWATIGMVRLTEQPGERIGRYKLLEKIGEGGRSSAQKSGRRVRRPGCIAANVRFPGC